MAIESRPRRTIPGTLAIPADPAAAPDGAPPQAVGSKPGHNRALPADDVIREFEDLLAQRKFGANNDLSLEQRIAELLGAAGRADATDDDTTARCGELVKQLGAAEKVITAAHVAAKEPYLAASRAIDERKRTMIAPLTDAKNHVTGKMNAYLDAERRRQEAERQRILNEQREAERQAQIERDRIAREQRIAEEAARAANQPAPEPAPVFVPEPEPVAPPPPPPVEPTRVRSDFGALTTGSVVWESQVTDYEVAFIAAGLSQNAKVMEAIDKAIASLVKGGMRKIDGVSIKSTTKARVR